MFPRILHAFTFSPTFKKAHPHAPNLRPCGPAALNLGARQRLDASASKHQRQFSAASWLTFLSDCTHMQPVLSRSCRYITRLAVLVSQQHYPTKLAAA